MTLKPVQNGLFEVNELGEVYRVKNGEKVLATQTKTGGEHNYRVVTAFKDGKQKCFYVHRLVAEAFIPNPENLPEISHIDGNPGNNRVENLQWCTRQQNKQHAYRTGLINPYANAKPCKVCGDLTRAKDEICPACKLDLKREAKQSDKLAAVRDEMKLVDKSVLTPTQKSIVEMRMSGFTLDEIGQVLGVSRQCIDQQIKSAMLKSLAPKETAATRKERLKLMGMRDKKELKLKRLKNEQLIVESSIKEIDRKLSLLKGDNPKTA